MIDKRRNLCASERWGIQVSFLLVVAALSLWSQAGLTEPRSITPERATRSDASETTISAHPFTVALDIGHTPKRGGAISARGVFEYEFNRRLVEELTTTLRSPTEVSFFVINLGRGEISLLKRAAEANEHEADLFLSIHHDSVKEIFLRKWMVEGKPQRYCDDFHGYSIFVSQKNPKAIESINFAIALGDSLLKAGFTPTSHHVAQEGRVVLDADRGVYAFDDLIVLKAARMPAVLLECGVIVNRNEEEKLNSPGTRRKLNGAIAAALETVEAGRRDPPQQ